ncbi:hypothetical protein CDAR_236701 [Caerostris darwini]|uniref:Uncharacterized protein n=1 Tax=Caerostris darwini TaxID=1538125 RepID=A0AAV4NHX6_9ARAC|nr:hypothetical protein CDAR_236701 [Caerostris darwini]
MGIFLQGPMLSGKNNRAPLPVFSRFSFILERQDGKYGFFQFFFLPDKGMGGGRKSDMKQNLESNYAFQPQPHLSVCVKSLLFTDVVFRDVIPVESSMILFLFLSWEKE